MAGSEAVEARDAESARVGYPIHALNILYFLAASFIFNAIYKNARKTGRLGRLGLD